MSELGPDHVLGKIERQEDLKVFSKETGNPCNLVGFLWRIKKLKKKKTKQTDKPLISYKDNGGF